MTEEGHRRRHRSHRRSWSRKGAPLADPTIDRPSQDKVTVERLRDPVPRDDRRSAQQVFVPDYGRIAHYRSAGGMGIRLDAGHRVLRGGGESVLRFAAGEGHRAGARVHRCRPAHGTLPAGIPHPRREDEHSVLDQSGYARQVSRRPVHDAVLGRNARTVSLPAAAGSRHAAVQLPGRSDRQRQPARSRASRRKFAAMRLRRPNSITSSRFQRELATCSWSLVPRSSRSGS